MLAYNSVKLRGLHDAARIGCGAGSLQRSGIRPSVCLSVCPVDRQQQRRTAGLLLSVAAGSRYRLTAAGAAYRLSIGICSRPSCGCG